MAGQQRRRIFARRTDAVFRRLHAHLALKRQAAAVDKALLQAVGRIAGSRGAYFQFQSGAASQLVHPCQVAAAEGVVVARAAGIGVVVGAHALLRFGAAEIAVIRAPAIEKELRRHIVAVGQHPVQARRQIDAFRTAVARAIRAAQQVLPAIGRVAQFQSGIVVMVVVAEQRAGHRIRKIAVAVGQLHVDAGREAHVAALHAQLELALRRLHGFLEHHIDGAGDRLRAVFGAGRMQNLDAFDHVRRQGVEREPGRRPLAIEQYLRVAAAQPPHADFATRAPGRAGDGNAGQALEHVGNIRVAILENFLAADDHLAGRIVAARIIAAALDFDGLHGLFSLQRCGGDSSVGWRFGLLGLGIPGK
ncbi:hypothetical protein D3C87_1179660 [compost metagenome]